MITFGITQNETFNEDFKEYYSNQKSMQDLIEENEFLKAKLALYEKPLEKPPRLNDYINKAEGLFE